MDLIGNQVFSLTHLLQLKKKDKLRWIRKHERRPTTREIIRPGLYLYKIELSLYFLCDIFLVATVGVNDFLTLYICLCILTWYMVVDGSCERMCVNVTAESDIRMLVRWNFTTLWSLPVLYTLESQYQDDYTLLTWLTV